MKALIAILAAALLGGAGHPDFTGVWRQDPARSDFGPGRAPQSYANRIEQSGARLRVVTMLTTADGVAQTYESLYDLDGAETTSTNPRGESRATVHWRDRNLVFDIRSKDGSQDYRMQETWTLSADGRVLTKRRRESDPEGEVDQRFVLEKQ
jgi:hypothetical protein